MRRGYKIGGKVCGVGGSARIGALLKPFIANIWVTAYDNSFVATADVSSRGRQTTVTVEYGKTQSLGTVQDIVYNSPVSGTAQISATLSGLDYYTNYYFRIKAESANGVVYSPVYAVFTAESVIIDTQIWTKNNLRLSSTPMGNIIPLVPDNNTWITAKTLYDNAYAATSGTEEEKEYEALKSAAMCCYPENLSGNETIYGRLYNWYALQLIHKDIIKYNTLNDIPYGCSAPAGTNYDSMIEFLGGIAVAGGKMKESGLDYWNSPNTGATNISGFGARASGGRISTDGSFAWDIGAYNLLWVIDSTNSESGKVYYMTATGENISSSTGGTANKIRGYSLRLLKNQTFPLILY